MIKNTSFIEINSQNVDEDIMQSIIGLYSSLIEMRVKIFKQKGIHQWQDNYAERNNPENVTKALKEDAGKKIVAIFDDNNRMIGAAMIKAHERPGFWEENDDGHNYGYITGFVTDPQFSGQGIGKTMMRGLAEYALQNGVEKFRCDCRSDSAEESFLVKFYKSSGLSVVGSGCKEATEKFEAYPYTLLEGTPKSIIEMTENSIKRNC